MNNALKGKIATIPQVDNTLSKAGFAADAKMVGDRLLKVSPEYAQNVIYNNENSGLNATDTQGAIDELVSYGLGGYAKGLTNVSLNSITKAGFYCFDAGVGVVDAPTSLPSILRVTPFYNGSFVEQEVILLDGKGTSVKRVCHNGSWQPWEYENPPMTLWEEYRTTERFLGKPVYTKLVTAKYSNDIGNTSGMYSFAIEFSTPSVQQLVRYCGTIESLGADGWYSPRPIPHFNDNGGSMGVNYMNNGGLAVSINKSVIPANTSIYIQLWYTKIGD